MTPAETAAALTNPEELAIDMPSLCRAAADSSPMPMAGLDGEDHIVRYVNLAFCLLTGKSKDELLGLPFGAIAPAGDECLAMLDRVYRTRLAETHVGQEFAAANPFYWSYAMWPMLAAGNRPLGIMVQVTEATTFHKNAVVMNQALMLGSVRQHELTEAAELLSTQLQAEILIRERAEQALIDSEKLASAGRMAAVLAHEINNPVAAVMNLLYLMQSTEYLPAQVLEYLEMADGELKRIAHITRQTLGFYRESSTPTSFKVATVLDSVTDVLKAKIAARQAMVQKRCDPQLEMIAMAGELRQVFSNLVLNSLDALDQKGRVVLRATSSPGVDGGPPRIRVTVADNGAGISAAALPRIFEPFFTTKGSIGNGLGLWVSQEIIAKHGGLLRVRSCTRGANRGTTFSVVLPARPA